MGRFGPNQLTPDIPRFMNPLANKGMKVCKDRIMVNNINHIVPTMKVCTYL